MARGPLDHPRLRHVEERLDAGQLDEAQRLLAEIGDLPLFPAGIAFLTTRLLIERGRLDTPGVIQRLRDILRMTAQFPEARALLSRAERGQLPSPATPGRGATAPLARSARGATAPLVERAASSEPAPPSAGRPSAATIPDIPRAPPLPSFTPPPDVRPSYAPQHVPAGGFAPDDIDPPTAREPLASRPSLDSSEPASAVGRDAREHAGRYARRPTAAVDVVRPRPSSRPPPAKAAAAGIRRDRQRLRSGRPPSDDDDPPSLVGIATALDEGRFDRAIELIELRGGERGSVLHARSLVAAGRRKEARAVLEQLAAGTLEPEARSAVARALIDVGDPVRAVTEAEHAYRQDPGSPRVQLTLAWTLLRVVRRRTDATLVQRAEVILHAFKARENPRPSLVQALRACTLAHSGDPERAIGAAQRALALDGRSADALFALALASARLGRHHDARAVWQRLRDVDALEADAVAPALAALGVELSVQGSSSGR